MAAHDPAAVQNQRCARARCMVSGPLQDSRDGHSSWAPQWLPLVGAGIGTTHLPLGWQLSIQGSLSSSLGCLKDDKRNRAEPTALGEWMSMTTRIWCIGTAPLPLCSQDHQTLSVREPCDAVVQVQSLSTQHRRSTSAAPLQCQDGPTKAARPHHSSYGRPSFIMAAVGRMAASTQSVRGCSGCTCPGFFPDKFHLELPDDHHQRAPTLRGVGRCVAAAGLELSAPLFQPHRVHVLIRCLLLPSQVAPSSPHSPLTTAARWSEVMGLLLLPLPPSQTSPRSVEASRARCARAVHVHVCCACTCTSSLSDQYQLNSDDTAA